jgi:hypothetical protein
MTTVTKYIVIGISMVFMLAALYQHGLGRSLSFVAVSAGLGIIFWVFIRHGQNVYMSEKGILVYRKDAPQIEIPYAKIVTAQFAYIGGFPPVQITYFNETNSRQRLLFLASYKKYWHMWSTHKLQALLDEINRMARETQNLA